MSNVRFSTTATEPTTPAGGKVVLYVDPTDKHLKQKDEDGTVFDLTNTDGLTDQEFSNKVGDQTDLTGVITLDDIIELNADISKIDIIAFEYFIQGSHYSYSGATAVIPTIAAGDSSTWVGIDSTGIIYSDNSFTDEETKTILPLARLQALQGESGPGSDMQIPLHLTFAIGQEGYNERAWINDTHGALYAAGGTYIENTSFPLQVDQEAGTFYTAQRRRTSFGTTANIEVSKVYHIGGLPAVQNRATLVVPLFYDNGTDIEALPTNKYVSHSLLRSPKEENLFFFIYGATLYDSQSQAEEAPTDYSIFQGQSASGLYPVANFVVGGESINIEAIQDKRPNFILPSESTGAGTLPPSSACIYITTPEETTITTQGVFVKAAMTTAEMTTSADFTVVGNNRLLYTGKTKRRFKVDLVCNITSADNNQEVKGRYAINDVTTVTSEQQQLGIGTRVGNLPLSCMPELDENDYIEFWIANDSGTGNLTVTSMNMNLISVD